MSALAGLKRALVGTLALGSLIAIGLGTWGSGAEAAIAPLQVKPGKLSPPIRAGAIAGGEASDEFSILGVKSIAAGPRKERFVISYGDRNGKPLKKEPGFFHVALDRNSKRVSIDLAQVSRTAIEPKDLSKILASSKLIADSDMTMDPQDGSTNITLNLRTPVAISVLAESEDAGKIVIELQESETGSRR